MPPRKNKKKSPSPTDEIKLIKSVVKFRTSAVRKTPFVKTKSVVSFIETGCSRRINEARKRGVVDAVYRGKQFSAVLTLHTDKESVQGIQFLNLNVDFKSGEQHATQDAIKLVRRNTKRFTTNTICFALVSMPGLRSILETNDFSVESVVLLGPTDKGLRNLVKKLDPPRNLNHLGLEIRKISSPKDIERVIKIYKSEFGRNPQFGRWAGDSRYLKWMKKGMIEDLKKKQLNGFVICSDRKVLGYFGYSIFPPNPVYPSCAGVEIALDQSIQGKGVAKTAYRLMLEELKRKRIVMIRGATSQPAVMGIGKILQRKPFAYLMRYRSRYFKSEHFDS